MGYTEKEIRGLNAYQLSVKLAEYGCLNIHLENNIAVFYLPYMIDERQYRYIKDRVRGFSSLILKWLIWGRRLMI